MEKDKLTCNKVGGIKFGLKLKTMGYFDISNYFSAFSYFMWLMVKYLLDTKKGIRITKSIKHYFQSGFF